MSDDAEAPGLTPPSMESRAADAPQMPFLPPAVRPAGGPALPPTLATSPSPPATPAVPSAVPTPVPPAAPQSQRPPAAFQPAQPPAAVAASRTAAPKQRRSPVTAFVVVVAFAGIAAGGLLGYRMVSGDANEATAIAATASTAGTSDGASTLPSTAVDAAPTPAGWVDVVEQSVGFSLPTATERNSAWLLDAAGQVEGPESAQYVITPGSGAISVIWDAGDPTGRETAIVDQVARIPGGEGAPAITNWTPIPSRIGTAVGADYAYAGEGFTLGAGRLLVLMTPKAVVVVRYSSTDDPKAIDSVFRSITIDGQPAF